MTEKDSDIRDSQPPAVSQTTRLGLWFGILALLVTVSVAYWGVHVRNSKLTPPPSGSVSSTSQTPSTVIGGPFSLTDHNGRAVTQQDFRGKFMLVMFGYTYCPDVCPTQLSTASDAIDALGEHGASVIPIFITIDPERDTAAHLKEYVSYFHPSMIALTGTPEQIKSVAKAYRVYYAKVQENKDDPEDYLMDHSALIYLMGPDGKFLAHFSHGTDAETMATRIREFL